VRYRASIISVATLLATAALAEPAEEETEDEKLDPVALEAAGAVIGRVVLEKRNVFDLSDPSENNWFFRTANRLHIVTRDRIIEQQLLFEAGEPFSERLVEESERILRTNQYFYDAWIEPVAYADGTVDLRVTTKDVWTLNPGISISRKGGENKTTFDIEELNLLGRGQLIRLARTDDVDRVTKSIEFEDRHLGESWVELRAIYADNSDGESNYLSVIRPFYALDTNWTAGTILSDFVQRGQLYDLGEAAAEYEHERKYYAAWGGWSAGLKRGWVRRYTAGVVYDENRFAELPDPTLPQAIPEDRKLVYPFLGIELLQDSFATTSNRNQIEKTEDLLTGTHLTASIGWSSESFGADRDGLIIAGSASRVFGSLEKTALSVAADVSGRVERGDTENARLSLLARYSHRFTEKSTFFATADTTFGHDLDLESPVEIGGDTGLRGYPLRYQSGDSRFLLSLEQRYFWDWYPLRLFRVGGAVFADVGRTWGDHPLGGEELGWLRDIGFGLRFAPTRTGSGKIVHVDIAFPLDGDPSIDDVQILLESKKSF